MLAGQKVLSNIILIRTSERMSSEESDIFSENLAYISQIRQNHSTFSLIATKNNLKEVISSEEPGMRLSPNISTTFLKIKMNKYIFL